MNWTSQITRLCLSFPLAINGIFYHRWFGIAVVTLGKAFKLCYLCKEAFFKVSMCFPISLLTAGICPHWIAWKLRVFCRCLPSVLMQKGNLNALILQGIRWRLYFPQAENICRFVCKVRGILYSRHFPRCRDTKHVHICTCPLRAPPWGGKTWARPWGHTQGLW